MRAAVVSVLGFLGIDHLEIQAVWSVAKARPHYERVADNGCFRSQVLVASR